MLMVVVVVLLVLFAVHTTQKQTNLCHFETQGFHENLGFRNRKVFMKPCGFKTHSFHEPLLFESPFPQLTCAKTSAVIGNLNTACTS